MIAPRYSHSFPYQWTFRSLLTFCYYEDWCSRRLCADLHVQGWSVFLGWNCGRGISGPRVSAWVSFDQPLFNRSPKPFCYERSPHPCWQSRSLFFFFFTCLKGVKWYLVVVICIFPITVEVQHTHTPLLFLSLCQLLFSWCQRLLPLPLFKQ